MSHKHDTLLRAVFHDPISGNIHWREIESLLNHLGAEIEPLSGARLRVKLNGHEGILHRPHHGNTLGRQDVQHLREYLAHARATPSQIEKNKKRGQVEFRRSGPSGLRRAGRRPPRTSDTALPQSVRRSSVRLIPAPSYACNHRLQRPAALTPVQSIGSGAPPAVYNST